MRETGTYQQLGQLKHFIPNPLPPAQPELNLDEDLLRAYGDAIYQLGQLNEMAKRLPDPNRFINAYVTKEALLSSEIEGIHTTLVDVYDSYRSPLKVDKDTQLVLNYTNAVNASLKLIQDKNLPLVSRVILEAHRVLLSGGEQDSKDPGNYRKQSVRVGNLIPPPASEIQRLMADLEVYINTPSSLPPLIRAGLAHVQFETIHPFLDGNGRIGRLLIVLMLMDSQLISAPILYPSFYFKKYSTQYYHNLDIVRTEGNFESWISFYLKAIGASAADAHQRAKAIESLEIQVLEKIRLSKSLTKSQETARDLLNHIFSNPVTDVTQLSTISNKAYNTVDRILNIFEQMEILKVTIAKTRNRIYRFEPYLQLLDNDLD